jgi:predicted Rossmann fold flavoprotein
MIEHFDVLVLGGGAAGLMCAIEAGKRGRRVAVIEHSERCGRKILISGGGRCNFTNLHCQPENFLSSNPHFSKSALARYTPSDFMALVEKHHIAFHEKTLGQLFCDGSAREILQMLEDECAAAAVKIFTRVSIHEISKPDEFVVRTSGAEFRSAKLVVATGGLSIPKIGATSFGYDLARQFGLSICPPRPGLVPLVLSAEENKRYCNLAGVSTDVVASSDKHRFREKMLITHKGLSGPAILQISSYWQPGSSIAIDLAPNRRITAGFEDPNVPRNLAALKSTLREFLPARLADRWLEFHVPKQFTNSALAGFEEKLHEWKITPAGTEGFDKAEVTAGGIDTNGLSAKTMECRKAPGLFFIGEVVDVTGQLGGFNFQWAWASGFSAGQAV